MATTAAPQGKQGKRKVKGKTVDLQSFLNDKQNAPEGFMVVNSKSWADTMEEEEVDDKYMDHIKEPTKVILPTAPKSVRAPDIDLSKVPTQPPFKAYLGNLPYEITEEDIFRFFKRLNVKKVQLPRDVGDRGRLRGFGYAEFPDRDTLIEALGFNNESIKNRPIRVSLTSGDNDRDHSDRSRRTGYNEEREDRTVGDWRSVPREDIPYREREQRMGGGKNEMSRNGAGNYNDFRDREFTREDMGRIPYGGRSSYERRDDRGFGRDFNRGGGYGRDGPPPRGPPRDDMDGFRRAVGGGRDFGSNFERNRREGGPPPSSQSPVEEPEGREGVPKERPKLQLTKRTKPIEEKNEPAATSAIFGGAKPVDTASREREIEEKLRKQSLDETKEETGSWSGERVRRMSSNSNVSGSGSQNRSRRGSESERSRTGRSDVDESSKRGSESGDAPREVDGGSGGGGSGRRGDGGPYERPAYRDREEKGYKGRQESRDFRNRNRNYNDNYAPYNNYPPKQRYANSNSRQFSGGDRDRDRRDRDYADSRRGGGRGIATGNRREDRFRADDQNGQGRQHDQRVEYSEKGQFKDKRVEEITSRNRFAFLNDGNNQEDSD